MWALAAASADAERPARLDRTDLMVYRTDGGEVAPVRSPRDWLRRRAEVLAGMQEVMGPLPGRERRAPLDVRIEEEVDCGAFVRRRITYTAEAGSRVPAYLLIPREALASKRKFPAVLGLHQTHRLGPRVVVGLGASPHDEYGVELARRGYVCLAPAYPLLAGYEPDLTALGYRSGTMKAVWDNIRGLDLLESLPFVRPGRFGAIGHSLGGHNSIFTAVFDERIRVVASSCGFDSFLDYDGGDITGWTGPRYMPRLREYPREAVPFDFQELIGALAPRACFVSAPLGDTNFRWRSVDAVAEAALPVYRLYRAATRLQVVHPDCGHLFPPEMREAAYRVLDASLR